LFGVAGNEAQPLDLEQGHTRVLLVTPLVNLPEERFLYGEHLARFVGEVQTLLEGFAERLESTTLVEEADQRTYASRSICRTPTARRECSKR